MATVRLSELENLKNLIDKGNISFDSSQEQTTVLEAIAEVKNLPQFLTSSKEKLISTDPRNNVHLNYIELLTPYISSLKKDEKPTPSDLPTSGPRRA